MTRDILKVDGVAPETKASLQEAAQQRYGQANASLMVRSLIGEYLARLDKRGRQQPKPAPAVDLADETIRVELRLPKSVVKALDELAEERFSTRNYYINALVFSHLGQPQLHGSEIEVLRRSNYELAKLGSNLNQIAKAFNLLVKLQGGRKLPEVGKKVASLKKEISSHTAKVLRVLNTRTVVWEAKGNAKTGKTPRTGRTKN